MSIINVTFNTESKDFRVFRDGNPIQNIESLSFFTFNGEASMHARMVPIKQGGETILMEVVANERQYWLLTEENGHVHFLDSADPNRSTMADNHSHLLEGGKVLESNNHIHELIKLEVLESVSESRNISLNRIFKTSHASYSHAVYVEHEGEVKIGRFDYDNCRHERKESSPS